jgi:hypothetical protein
MIGKKGGSDMYRQANYGDHAVTYTRTSTINPDINRLFCAAAISKNFRTLLLSNPSEAVTRGFQGETFNLSKSEILCLQSIHARDISDFAAQYLRFSQSAALKLSYAACD